MYKKYPSITNSYNEKFLNIIRENVHPNALYIVSEKLHGANFSFCVDYTREIVHCSRNQTLAKDGFYNHRELDKYHTAILGIYDELMCFENGIVRIYGEYAGQGIQKGVNYGDKDFYCFDISVDGVYLTLDVVARLCRDFGIKMPKTFMIGTLDKCLEFDIHRDSAILGIEDNLIEGVVISPLIPVFLNHDRVIIKHKNPEFAEIGKHKPKKPKKTLSSTDSALLATLCTYLTDNRVNAVMSKEGTWDKFGKLLGAVAKDALSDCQTDNPDTDFSDVTKLFNKEVSTFIRPVFLKQLY